MRRWALRIGVCVVVGVVVNVLVAWGLNLDRQLPGNTVRFSSLSTSPGDKWPVRVPSSWPEAPETIGRLVSSDLGRNVEIWAYAKQEDGREVSVHVLRSGWPAKAVERTSWSSFSPWNLLNPSSTAGLCFPREGVPSSIWHVGLKIDLDLAGWSFRGRTVPLHPVWPGFAVNTLAYGAVAWGVLFAPGVVKRWRRRRRGACVGCGYELAGLVRCPECGK